MKKTEYLVIGGIAFLYSFIMLVLVKDFPYFQYWFVFVPIIGVWIGIIINNYYQSEEPFEAIK